MKKLFVGLMLCFSATVMAAASNEIPLDKIVVVINNEVITQSQLDQRIAIAKQQMQGEGAPLPTDAQIRPQVLQQMINENVQLQIAKRNKVEITNVQLTQALAKIAARNNLTLDQLKGAIEKQGINYDAFRKQLQNQMLMTQVQERAIGPVAVNDQEVNDYLRHHADQNLQYHVQDLLIQLPSTPTREQLETARQQAKALTQQLHQNFHQALPAGVQNNDLGWRPLSELPEIFVSSIAHMKVGDVNGPIQAPNGLHVIKLLEQRGDQQVTKDQVKSLLYQQKMEKQIEPWLQKVRSTAYIKIMN